MNQINLSPLALSTLTISSLAQIIQNDWKPVHYTAKPYLSAMFCLDSIKDKYLAESGVDMVSYFLSNAAQWKGETAKAIKKELNKRVKNS